MAGQNPNKLPQENLDLIHLRSLHLVEKYSSQFTKTMLAMAKDKKVNLKEAGKKEQDKILTSFNEECERESELLKAGVEDLLKQVTSITMKIVKGEPVAVNESMKKNNDFLINQCSHNYIKSMEQLMLVKTKGWNECVSEKAVLECHKKSVKLSAGYNSGDKKSNAFTCLLDMKLDDLLQAYQTKNTLNYNKKKIEGTTTAAIGIDLGGTTSCVAVYMNGRAIVCPTYNKYAEEKEWNLIIPSFITLPSHNNEIEFGESAREGASHCTYYDVIHIIGKKMNDPFIQDNVKKWPFTLEGDPGGMAQFKAYGSYLRPSQVLNSFIDKIMMVGERYYDGTAPGIIVTVPSHSEEQRDAIEGALNQLRFQRFCQTLPRYAAAAATLKLELRPFMNLSRVVLVFDLGSRFFEASLIRIEPNVASETELLAFKSDLNLGGDNFHRNLMGRCAENFHKTHGINLHEYEENIKGRNGNLWKECERAKILLNEQRCTTVNMTDEDEKHNLKVRVTREMFEDINMKDFMKAIDIVDEIIKFAGISKENVDEILLVGASTKIPKIRELLMIYFQCKVHFNQSMDPEHVIACGAAIAAAWRNGAINKRVGNNAKGTPEDEDIVDTMAYKMMSRAEKVGNKRVL